MPSIFNCLKVVAVSHLSREAITRQVDPLIGPEEISDSITTVETRQGSRWELAALNINTVGAALGNIASQRFEKKVITSLHGYQHFNVLGISLKSPLVNPRSAPLSNLVHRHIQATVLFMINGPRGKPSSGFVRTNPRAITSPLFLISMFISWNFLS